MILQTKTKPLCEAQYFLVSPYQAVKMDPTENRGCGLFGTQNRLLIAQYLSRGSQNQIGHRTAVARNDGLTTIA